MADQYTTTSKQGYGSRLGGAFKGILGGLAIFALSFVLLWWNEGRTVRQTRALEEGAGVVVEADAATVDPALEGQLVHVTGVLTNLETLADGEFGVEADALALRRRVQMYQWVEHTKTSKKVNLGGSETTETTYTYVKEWVDGYEDSSRFAHPEGHGNLAPRYEAAEWFATARLGARDFPAERLAAVGDAEPVTWEAEWQPVDEAAIAAQNAAIDAENEALLAAATDGAVPELKAHVDLEAAKAAAAAKSPKKLAGSFYIGKDPAAPEVGDMRVSYEAVKAHEVSVVAAQKGSTFGAWTAKNGNAIFLQSDGIRTAEEQFAGAKSANKVMAWLLRLVGFVMMMAGLKAVLAPLKVLADVLPFLGSIVGWANGVVAFLVALPLTLVTIGLAWLAYRPMVGIPLLVVAGVLLVMGIVKAAKKKPAAAS